MVPRQNLENESVAFQIEAALIDAYPGLTDEVGGQGSDDYNCRDVEQIIAEYAAVPLNAERTANSHFNCKELCGGKNSASQKLSGAFGDSA